MKPKGRVADLKIVCDLVKHKRRKNETHIGALSVLQTILGHPKYSIRLKI